ncbi:MAG: hypothetical protein CL912_29175 [Deltaproteobacteria bacterium]|nr:hypothetical protein [Deltaproteobacteria bacterium]
MDADSRSELAPFKGQYGWSFPKWLQYWPVANLQISEPTFFTFNPYEYPCILTLVIAYRTRLGILILATLITTKLSYPSSAGSKIA